MGTKMMLHRYSPATKDWDTTEVIIDQAFLDTNGAIDPVVPTGYVYEPGKDLLKVYLNGQRLSVNGAYIEVDDLHIQLMLGDDEDGAPLELQIGEELLIEVYKNQYCSRGQATISGTEFYQLKKEIVDARQYKDTDNPSLTLDERLDSIQRQLEIIHGGSADVDIEYEYNAREQVLREVITGDYTVTREFTYYEDEIPRIKGEIKTEVITYIGEDGVTLNKLTKNYSYDPVTRKLLRTRVRSD